MRRTILYNSDLEFSWDKCPLKFNNTYFLHGDLRWYLLFGERAGSFFDCEQYFATIFLYSVLCFFGIVWDLFAFRRMNSLEIDFHRTARGEPTIFFLGVVKCGDFLGDFRALGDFFGDFRTLAFDLGILLYIQGRKKWFFVIL